LTYLYVALLRSSSANTVGIGCTFQLLLLLLFLPLFQAGVSLYSCQFTFVNGPLVCEDFMPVWLGFLFFFGGFLILFLFGPFLSCIEQEPPVVFGSTNGRTPPRATYPPFDSLMVAHSMNYSSLLGSAPTTGSLRLFLPSFLSWK
jgi:hypothetical protein